MKFEKIPEFLSYRDFAIEAQADRHTVCRVSFIIETEKANDFINLAEQRQHTDIISNNGNKIMSGLVSEVTITYGVSVSVAETVILSKSSEYQRKGQERIFQNPNQTYAELLNAFPFVLKGKCEHLNDTINSVIFQHHMDDFTFLSYLAELCHEQLWITEDGEVTFGKIGNEFTFSDRENDRQSAILDKQITATPNSRTIQIHTLQQLPNGTIVHYQQNHYTVCRVNITEQYDETYFQYTICTNPITEQGFQISPLVTKARVSNQNDPEKLGRIQVEFLELEDNAAEKTWIPYLTPFVGKHKNGIIMIPDVGDEVIVIISEGVPYAVNSIRNDTLPDHYHDISKKYFAVNDSIITFSDSEIVLSREQSILKMDNSSISLSAEKSSVKLTDDSIDAESGNSKLTMKNDQLNADNGNGHLHIKNGSTKITGGSSEVSLDNGTTKVSGSHIDLSTQGFSL